MSTTVLLGLPSFEKIGGQWIFGGASDFSNILAPWASGSRSLMLRAVMYCITTQQESICTKAPGTIIHCDEATMDM